MRCNNRIRVLAPRRRLGRAHIDRCERRRPEDINIREDAQTARVDGVYALLGQLRIGGVSDDVLQLVGLEDLHQICSGGEAVLGQARQAPFEHELVRLVRGETQRRLGCGGEGGAGERQGAVEERVHLDHVVGPAVDGVDDVETALGGLAAVAVTFMFWWWEE